MCSVCHQITSLYVVMLAGVRGVAASGVSDVRLIEMIPVWAIGVLSINNNKLYQFAVAENAHYF